MVVDSLLELSRMPEEQLNSTCVTTAPHRTGFYASAIALVVVVSRLSYSVLMGEYVSRLISARQFRLSHFSLDNSDVVMSIILLAELLFAFLLLRSRIDSRVNDALPLQDGSLRLNISVAVLGIVLSILAIPFTPIALQPFMLADLILDNLLFSRKLVIPAVLLILLPLLAEVVFQKIILTEWHAKMGTIPAVLATSSVFALSWTLTSGPSALFIGLAALFVSSRSKSIWPGFLIIRFGTVSCIGVLVWQAIVRGHVV